MCRTDAIILMMRNIIPWSYFVEKSEEMVSQPPWKYTNGRVCTMGQEQRWLGWSYRSHTSLLLGPGHLCAPRTASVCTWDGGEELVDHCMEDVRAQSQNCVIMFVGWTLFHQHNPHSCKSTGGFIGRWRSSCWGCCILRTCIPCASPVLLSRDAWHQGPALCRIHPCAPNQSLPFSMGQEPSHGNLGLPAQPELAVPVLRQPDGAAHPALLNRARRLAADSVNKWQNWCARGLLQRWRFIVLSLPAVLLLLYN